MTAKPMRHSSIATALLLLVQIDTGSAQTCGGYSNFVTASSAGTCPATRSCRTINPVGTRDCCGSCQSVDAFTGETTCWAYTCGDTCQDTPCDACPGNYVPLPSDVTGSRTGSGTCPASRPHKTDDTACCGACLSTVGAINKVWPYECGDTCQNTPCEACGAGWTALPSDSSGSRRLSGTCPANRPHQTLDGCCGACTDGADVFIYDCGGGTCSDTPRAGCQNTVKGTAAPVSAPPPARLRPPPPPPDTAALICVCAREDTTGQTDGYNVGTQTVGGPDKLCLEPPKDQPKDQPVLNIRKCYTSEMERDMSVNVSGYPLTGSGSFCEKLSATGDLIRSECDASYSEEGGLTRCDSLLGDERCDSSCPNEVSIDGETYYETTFYVPAKQYHASMDVSGKKHPIYQKWTSTTPHPKYLFKKDSGWGTATIAANEFGLASPSKPKLWNQVGMLKHTATLDLPGDQMTQRCPIADPSQLVARTDPLQECTYKTRDCSDIPVCVKPPVGANVCHDHLKYHCGSNSQLRCGSTSGCIEISYHANEDCSDKLSAVGSDIGIGLVYGSPTATAKATSTPQLRDGYIDKQQLEACLTRAGHSTIDNPVSKRFKGYCGEKPDSASSDAPIPVIIGGAGEQRPCNPAPLTAPRTATRDPAERLH